MILLDQMAKTGRLYEFISAVVRIRNEEQEEKVMWEYWLHKDFERSYHGRVSLHRSCTKQMTSKLHKFHAEICPGFHTKH